MVGMGFLAVTGRTDSDCHSTFVAHQNLVKDALIKVVHWPKMDELLLHTEQLLATMPRTAKHRTGSVDWVP